MTAGLPEPFPPLQIREDEDRNPAIRLFGRRFYADQGALELLAELLAVAFCEKRIAGRGRIDAALPSLGQLSDWPAGAPLQYRPPIKLNLKLFAFLTGSRIDTRHPVHEQHYERLVRRLEGRIEDGEPGEVVEWLEDLLRGFQGAGPNRAWCAQTFLPISELFITQETLWNETFSRRNPPADWDESVRRFRTHYSVSRHRFLARGGELLYLQVCNALATEPSAISGLVRDLRRAEPGCLTGREADPQQLHAALEQSLTGLRSSHSPALDRLVDVIEELDTDTSDAVNRSGDQEEGWLSCAWCPEESWREGYLFAVELSRVLEATLDPAERVELLTTGCALQVLRSLCAQSARYADRPLASAPLGYAWIVGPPEGAARPLRVASQRNLQTVQSLIQRALRTEELQRNAQGHRVPQDRLYREADSKGGHKLFLSLGKKLGFIVPKRGPGARFTMTDGILRYLVLALLRPGERCTYDSFLKRLYIHYGLAVEGEDLADAAAWSGLPSRASIESGDGRWLEASLRAGGFLTQLSDAWSIVRNPYALADDSWTGGAA